MSHSLDRLDPNIMQTLLAVAPSGAFEDRTRLQAGIWLLGRLGLDHGIRHWTCNGSPSADAICDELAAGIAQGRIGRDLRRPPGRPVVETFRALRAPAVGPLWARGLEFPQLGRAVHLLHAAPVLDVALAATVDWLRARERCLGWRSHAMNRTPHCCRDKLERAAALLRALGIDPDLAEVTGVPPEVHRRHHEA